MQPINAKNPNYFFKSGLFSITSKRSGSEGGGVFFNNRPKRPENTPSRNLRYRDLRLQKGLS